MASTSGQLRATLILVSEFAAMNVLRGSDDALQCGWKSILLAQMWTAPMRWSDFSLNVWWAFRPLLALLVEAIRLALKTRQWPLAPAVCIRAMSEAARCCSSAAMLR
jgi:hypothetical protein